ncbi:MAG: prolyl-tRNA synthetase associated domain-containing protein, partial [Myxococcales bacterium]|nr:prolyl-tRNA synthetase associated domain-containing protein [Myxococcales bacterium]
MPEETPARETPAQETPAQLPTSPEDLLARLAELGIETRIFTHPPVHTVAQAQARRGEIEGAHI